MRALSFHFFSFRPNILAHFVCKNLSAYLTNRSGLAMYCSLTKMTGDVKQEKDKEITSRKQDHILLYLDAIRLKP
jgi:hypothetical protein